MHRTIHVWFIATWLVLGQCKPSTWKELLERREVPGEDCICGLPKRKQRIIGGVETEINEYPWQVALTKPESKLPFCGGSLISDQWVLTAAHCILEFRFQILLGEHDVTTTSETDSIRSNVAEVIKHPKYRGLNYDFALVKLSSPVDFSKHPHIRPICLPENESENYDDFSAIVTGWGTTSEGGYTSSELMEVKLQVMSNKDCKAAYGRGITKQMICAAAENKDSCQGDSGGPMISSGSGNGVNPGENYEHIGVVSWGTGCALPDYPGVYA